MGSATPTDTTAPYILTLDIGSSSTRALVYDGRARRVMGIEARASYQIETHADGRSEIDADLLVQLVCRCIDSAVSQASARQLPIAAVAIDTFVSNLLALDAAGVPISKLITYADTRNDDDARRLRQELDEASIHERTGCLLRTSYWPARLAWIRRAQPGLWRAAARWITFGEYLELQLFGRARAGLSPASWSGMLDRRALVWDHELLDYLELPADRLSPLADFSEGLRGLLPAFAERWPGLHDVPWFPALGDGAAANVGSGCDTPNRLALTVGTTGALRVVLPAVDQVPAGLWCYRVDSRRALLGGATSEGGNVYSWLATTTRLGEPVEVERALAMRQPDDHGLTVLPFWAGERSPGWAGNARAALVGMTLATTALEILHASLESVAYRFALIAASLLPAMHGSAAAQASQEREVKIVVSGGGLQQSPAWTQIVADALGRTLVMSNEDEATSRGGALLALEALGVIETTTAYPAQDGEMITPNPERHAIYRKAIERQLALYRSLVQRDLDATSPE